MPDAHPVTIPLLNPNEPEALLAGLHIKEGQKVSEGDLICSLETTKSTSELAAESDGYIVGLNFKEGDTARAGDILCYLAPSADWRPPKPKTVLKTAKSDEIPDGLRITGPALKLAQAANLDLSTLPIGPLVTENMLENLLGQDTTLTENLTEPHEPYDPKAILVYGGSGHGKSVIDLLRAIGGYNIQGVIDDGVQAGKQVMDAVVLGGADQLAELHAKETRMAANAVGGIGDIMSRVHIFNLLAEAGYFCPPLVHPTALVESSAVLAPGVQVFPHAYVGSDTSIGFGCIVNTGAIISHDCTVKEYANIAPGAILAGAVQVGEAALIGMGVTINLNTSVGSRARIGNSAVVKADVPTGGVVRAGAVWPK
ncbi:MAG: NeuD/PglB/VioB family sugar acetyltransferase [Chloroflexi bacterium]|nr:NeuD/PglB/VioB family sugar acetyltransferase [Chloroflexota bacterium]